MTFTDVTAGTLSHPPEHSVLTLPLHQTTSVSVKTVLLIQSVVTVIIGGNQTVSILTD